MFQLAHCLILLIKHWVENSEMRKESGQQDAAVTNQNTSWLYKLTVWTRTCTHTKKPTLIPLCMRPLFSFFKLVENDWPQRSPLPLYREKQNEVCRVFINSMPSLVCLFPKTVKDKRGVMQPLRAWSLNAYLNPIIDYYISRSVTLGKWWFLSPQDRCFACHLRIIIAYLRKLSWGIYELKLISNSILCNHSCYEHMCTDVGI